MADRHVPRLFVDRKLAADTPVTLPADQAHYLGGVMRLEKGDRVIAFDDRTGEWRSRIDRLSRKAAVLVPEARLRERESGPDIWLLAAPIRRARYEWMAEKACELGAGRFVPTVTARTQRQAVQQAKPERLRAHMIEAAEQCGRTALPALRDVADLADLLAAWPGERALIFCDEEGGAAALETIRDAPAPAAILIGPEGGVFGRRAGGDPSGSAGESDQPRAADPACRYGDGGGARPLAGGAGHVT